FSALAFTVLENAMSVIFFHRVKIKRRHFLVSAVMPYVFIVFLGLGLLVTTVVSGIFQFIGAQNITFFGQPRSLGPVAALLIYLLGAQVIAEYERIGHEPIAATPQPMRTEATRQ